jgi:parvulin-like peptidyl-prolyl isomerase
MLVSTSRARQHLAVPGGDRTVIQRLRAVAAAPLFRFLLLGLAVFALDRWTASRAAEETVVVTEAQVARLAALWERQWRRPPTNAELEGLVADQVREEILYREAVRRGLDEDDPIVRRRLAQKLAFLAEDRALPETPPEAELRAFFEADPERYARPARWTLRQIPFTAEAPDDVRQERASAALDALRSDSAPALSSLGDASMLPRRVAGWTPREVAAEFGGDFAAALEALPEDAWSGPVESAYGLHLVYPEVREPPAVPSFETARREVERDWLEQAREAADAAFYADLLERYQVEIAAPGVEFTGPGA